ncbi:hypothetical protein GCM10029992_23070 [Glycomyces albus]
MSGRDRKEASGGALIAGSMGALIACCAVPILIAVGVIAGMSGFAFGGLILGIGLAIAAVTWLIAWRLRKRHACRAPTDHPRTHSNRR